MSHSIRRTILLVALFTLVGSILATLFNPEPAAGAPGFLDSSAVKPRRNVAGKWEPVDNMHHFMEYVYEPTYGKLKAELAKEPTDKKGWANIKSASLILAEASSLLAERVPEKGENAVWEKTSELVYQRGADLYQAARKKDFDAVRKHFASMSKACSACHEKFRK